MTTEKKLNKALVAIVSTLISLSLSSVQAGKARLKWLKGFKDINTVVLHLNNILIRGEWLSDEERDTLSEDEQSQTCTQRKQSLKRSMVTQSRKAGFSITENGEDVPFALYVNGDIFHSGTIESIKEMDKKTSQKKNRKNAKKVIDGYIQAGGSLPDTVTTIASLLNALPTIEGTINKKDGLFLFNWITSKIDNDDIDGFMKGIAGYTKKDKAPISEKEQQKIDAQKTLDEMAENIARFQAKVANM